MAGKAEASVSLPWSIESADRGGSPPPALGDLLVAPALAWPDRTAISDGEASYTFAQLEQGARAVAARLAEQGVGPGDRVAILAEKRAVMPLLILAVWKCGAVYAPLDGSEPAARLQGLLSRLQPGARRAAWAADACRPWSGGRCGWPGRGCSAPPSSSSSPACGSRP